jgi:hypothetical protein
MTIKLPHLYIVLGLLFISLGLANAQSLNNEWVDYSKSYIKIPVPGTGICRLTYDQLAALGAPVNAATKSTIKLYHRGKEQNIYDYVGSSSFTSYMEFFGQKNDGKLDSNLYGSEKQLNKYFNLFSDTSYYFLTWDGNDGKRMLMDSVGAIGARVNYHLKDTLTVFSNEYAMGYLFSDYTHQSAYNTGEGWSSVSIKGDYAMKIPTPNYSSTQQPLKLNLHLVSRNDYINTIIVAIGKSPSSTIAIDTLTINQYGSFESSYELNDNTLLNDSLYVIFKNENNNARYSISYLSVKYPQTINDKANRIMTIPAGAGDYVALAKQSKLKGIYDISDVNNVKKVGFTQTDSLRFGIKNPTMTSTFYFDFYDPIDSIKIEKVKFRKYISTANTFVIISHPSLMKKGGSYNNPVRAYADYRASLQGGKYDTLLVSVNDLYNQYSYGEKTPLAIRNFCRELTLDTLTKPKYLFILGKAYEYGFPTLRHKTNPSYIDLVPTYGTPGSDVKLTSGYDNTNLHLPLISTGRFSALNSNDVASYLDKVKEHEALPYDQLWRKNMIHLSGGKDAGQIADFRGIMDGLKNIAENKYKGAQVTSFTKSTSDIQVFNISESVNKGTSVITFFGHSSPTSNDINIGDASDPFLGYNNKGKYPIIILHGCKAGNPFTETSFGENWMKTPNKGAIAMMGNTDFAYADLLNTYANTFYNTSFKDSIFFTASIGDINKEVIRRFPNPSAQREGAQLDQMVLQADPSIVLFGPSKPDYYTNNDQLFLKSFDGKPVTAVSDSFAVGIIISNFGRVTSQGFALSVERTVDGVKKNLPVMKLNPVAYRDTVYYVLYSRDLATAGQNSIKVTLNYNDAVLELNKNNNVGILNFYVPKTGLNCLMPQEFSIVNTTKVSLVAQATDVLSDNRDFVFELDTSYYFNSGQYQTGTINAGATAIWKDVDLFSKLPSNTDSVVFFWRVKYKTLLPGEFPIVAQSSFIYIKNGVNGWSQTVFEQFNKDVLVDGLEKDTISKRWIFGPKKLNLDVVTVGDNGGNYSQTVIKINDFPVVKDGNCYIAGGDGIYAIAFDKNTLKPYTFFDQPLFGSAPIMKCTFQPVNRFVNLRPDYKLWPDYKAYFKQFVDSVKTGDYVLLVSAGNANFETWEDGNNQPPFNKYLNKKVEELGCQKLPYLKDKDPYIFLGQKGNDVIAEIIADTNGILFSSEQTITLDTFLVSSSPNAALVTTKIGPTTQWGNFYRSFVSLETPSQDEWLVDVIGVNLKGEETTILKDTALADGFNLASVVDASLFPYLRLKVTLRDYNKFTPAQIKKLQVTFEPVPEGTVVLEGAKYKNIGAKQEGDSVVLDYSFQNIFTKDFESPLLVHYKLTTNAKEVLNFNDTINKILMPDSAFKIKKIFSTLGRVGDNVLEVFVNPLNQPEQLFDNNRWVMPYRVVADHQNPLLDVYFDGIRIMNGDIVSSNPDIQVVLKDENKFLKMNDTLGLSIFLKKCESCEFERISLASPDLFIHYPSSANNNKLSVNYYPKNLADGKYTLRVQGADVSNNRSGLQPYQISFEVVNKSAVSNFYPYPNPFSTSTRFVYTLTGSIIPDEVKIQIVTATGKVVREITQNELGQLRPGTHQTDFIWNGTDEFGDKLANGVYLYRVLLRANGKSIDAYKTAGDKAFTDGWGKMYILR